MNDVARPIDRLIQMRTAFDQSFAEAPKIDTTLREDLLAIRLEETDYAVHLSAVSGLFADKKITRVPSRAPGLLGVAGFRGSIIPVYDFAQILEHPPTTEPRWLLLAAALPIALAFNAFDGHLRVSRDSLAVADTTDHSRKFTREYVRVGNTVRAIVDFPPLLDALAKRISSL